VKIVPTAADQAVQSHLACTQGMTQWHLTPVRCASVTYYSGVRTRESKAVDASQTAVQRLRPIISFRKSEYRADHRTSSEYRADHRTSNDGARPGPLSESGRVRAVLGIAARAIAARAWSACLIVAERRKLPNAGSPLLAPVALSSGPGGSSGQQAALP
jgi:hypothetical protein